MKNKFILLFLIFNIVTIKLADRKMSEYEKPTPGSSEIIDEKMTVEKFKLLENNPTKEIIEKVVDPEFQKKLYDHVIKTKDQKEVHDISEIFTKIRFSLNDYGFKSTILPEFFILFSANCVDVLSAEHIKKFLTIDNQKKLVDLSIQQDYLFKKKIMLLSYNLRTDQINALSENKIYFPFFKDLYPRNLTDSMIKKINEIHIDELLGYEKERKLFNDTLPPKFKKPNYITDYIYNILSKDKQDAINDYRKSVASEDLDKSKKEIEIKTVPPVIEEKEVIPPVIEEKEVIPPAIEEKEEKEEKTPVTEEKEDIKSTEPTIEKKGFLHYEHTPEKFAKMDSYDMQHINLKKYFEDVDKEKSFEKQKLIIEECKKNNTLKYIENLKLNELTDIDSRDNLSDEILELLKSERKSEVLKHRQERLNPSAPVDIKLTPEVKEDVKSAVPPATEVKSPMSTKAKVLWVGGSVLTAGTLSAITIAMLKKMKSKKSLIPSFNKLIKPMGAIRAA